MAFPAQRALNTTHHDVEDSHHDVEDMKQHLNTLSSLTSVRLCSHSSSTMDNCASLVVKSPMRPSDPDPVPDPGAHVSLSPL